MGIRSSFVFLPEKLKRGGTQRACHLEKSGYRMSPPLFSPLRHRPPIHIVQTRRYPRRPTWDRLPACHVGCPNRPKARYVLGSTLKCHVQRFRTSRHVESFTSTFIASTRFLVFPCNSVFSVVARFFMTTENTELHGKKKGAITRPGRPAAMPIYPCHRFATMLIRENSSPFVVPSLWLRLCSAGLCG